MKNKYIFNSAVIIFFIACVFLLAQVTMASSFDNPIGAQTVAQVLSSTMTYLKGIAMFIALIFIIIGGVMYMLSMGDKDMMERGKKTLLYAIAGFAIVLAAPTFLNEIARILGGSTSGISGSSLQAIALNVLNLLLSIVGLLAIIAILIGSIWMFSAGGDKERYELGKKTIKYAIVGIIIAVGALIIVQQIQSIISGGF
jgi:Type IV secretion system pilin